ncbi:hypothetical protein HOP50_02g12920 [Chloropicon primus]|nr:hypothetical protein HOP50_02g12920 [Chloropicon primus]
MIRYALTLALLLALAFGGRPAVASEEVEVCAAEDLKNAIESGTYRRIIVTCDQLIGPQLNFKPTTDLTIEGRCSSPSGVGPCKMTALNLQQHSSCSVVEDTCHWKLVVKNMIFDGSSNGYGNMIYWKSDHSNQMDEGDFTGSVSFESCIFRNLLNPVVVMTRFDVTFSYCSFSDNVGKASSTQSMGGTNYFPGRGGAIRVIRGEVVVLGCTFENNSVENSATGETGQGSNVWIGALSVHSSFRPKVEFSGSNSITSTSNTVYVKVDDDGNILGSAVDVAAPPPSPPPPPPEEVEVCAAEDLKNAIESGTYRRIIVTCDQLIGPQLNFKPTTDLTIEGRCSSPSGVGPCKMTALNLQQHSSCSVVEDTCHWKLVVKNMIFDGSSNGYGNMIYWKSDHSNQMDEGDFTGSVSFESCIFRNLLNPVVVMTRFDVTFSYCSFSDNVGKASSTQSMGGTNYFPGRGGAIRVIRGEVVVLGCTFENNSVENSATGETGQGSNVWIGALSVHSSFRPKVEFSGSNSITSTSNTVYVKVDDDGNILGSAVDVAAPPPSPTPPPPEEVEVCAAEDLKNAIESGTYRRIIVTCDQLIGPQLNFKPTTDLTIEGRCSSPSGVGPCKMTALNLQQHSSCSVVEDTCHWKLVVKNMIFDGSSNGYGNMIYWKSDHSNQMDEGDFTGSVSFESCIFRNLLNPVVVMTRFDVTFSYCSFSDNVGKASSTQSMGGTNYFPGRGGAIRVIRGEVVVLGCTFENNSVENSATGETGQGSNVWIGALSVHSSFRPKVEFSGSNSITSTSNTVYVKVDDDGNILGSALQADGKLQSLAEDVRRSWALTAGVPIEAVVVTLKKGSLITEVEINFEGQDKKGDAEKAQEGVKNYELVVDVIQTSPALSSALGIQDTSTLTAATTKTFTRIEGKVQLTEESGSSDGSWLSSGKRVVILVFGGLVIVTLGFCGLSRRYSKKKPQDYLAKAKQADRMRQEQELLPTHISTNKINSNKFVTMNPLSAGL